MGFNALIVSLFTSAKTDGMTAEQCAQLLFAVAESSYRSMPWLIRWIARKLLFSRLFLWFARRSAAQVRDHPEGWKIEYRTGDGQISDWWFECAECGVVKYMRKHGAAELTPYCNYVDYLQSSALALGMQNPVSIGQGSDVCREFFKQGRRTVLPDNLRPIADATLAAAPQGAAWLPTAHDGRRRTRVRTPSG